LPTGVALLDARDRLFDAAERVLVRDGPNALTSRSVTDEAGVAKGVLHRHFADFDAFMVELIVERAARVDSRAIALRQSVGAKTVEDNLTDCLLALFEPVSVAIVSLVISRDVLRSRLRQAGYTRIPLLGKGVLMVAGYLSAERDLGRVASHADTDTLAPILIGSVHLLITDDASRSPERDAVRKLVATVMAGAV
jgi:AcrR family transcriptional regulator